MDAGAHAQQFRPRQDPVLKYLAEHPGATLGEMFHHLRAHEQGWTYESVRAAVQKLLSSRTIRRRGTGNLYCSPLYLEEKSA